MQCFLIERSGQDRVALRRYSSNVACPARRNAAYHEAKNVIATVDGDEPTRSGRLALADYPASDPRWPTRCECGYVFTAADEWQVFTETLYRRADGSPGEIVLREAPPGAMWDASWYHEWRTGPDGKAIIVVCPDGSQWFIDGPASNCTMPNDQAHRCWVRHGTPPLLTVDKNGHTCAAGAGSIAVKGYHGFLRNGQFT